MEAGDVHALPQIEALRPVALCSRVQMQELAVVFPRLIAQPIDQSFTVTFGPARFAANKIINVQVLAHEERRAYTVARHRHKSVSRHRAF
jgi:hypothetical protein